MSSLRTAAAIGGAALLSGLALVACGESDPTISTNAGGSDAPMTDAEFCSAIKTDLVDPAEAAASPTDLTSTTDPRAEFDHMRSIVDRAPASIHGPMTVYFDAITGFFDAMNPSGDQPSTTMGSESIGELSKVGELFKVMAEPPVQDALKSLQTYSRDTCKLQDDDNPFAHAIGSSGADSTFPTGGSGSSTGSDVKLPDGYEATLQAHLISVGIGSDTDAPSVELTHFQRSVTVTVSSDVDALAACEAASDFAFGESTPAGAADLVSIEQGFDAKIVAQRKPADAQCQTSGFVYQYISDYLHAEHAGASWIGQISGGGYSSTGDGYSYSVSVQDDTTDADALDICRQSAGYAFGPRVDPPAATVEVSAQGSSGGGTKVLAHATSADDCAAGPPN